jgi:hypothetical protein
MSRISGVAEQLPASQGLSSMKLVILSFKIDRKCLIPGFGRDYVEPKVKK